jgi:hypothetical protein
MMYSLERVHPRLQRPDPYANAAHTYAHAHAHTDPLPYAS